MENVHVKIADLAALKNNGILVTFGLGSCVGIALYDQKVKVGGLAHILLNDSLKFIRPNSSNTNPAKFADTAVPLLITKMIELGAAQRNMVAKIAGGASLFNFKSESGNVGEKNIEAVRKALQEENIKIVFQEVGGSCGRTMRLMVDTGEVSITMAGKGTLKK